MAGTIKGITIQIEGKTDPLVKSLQSVETQIKKDDAALKNLEKALELDPTNVDLLAAKEAVLADKTEAVTSKMEILQQVQQDALSDLPEDSQLTAAQMAELEAEIANTSATLNDLEDGAGAAGDELDDAGAAAGDAGEEAELAGDGFETLGEAAEVAGEVAVAAMEAVVTAAAAVATAAIAAGTAVGSAMVTATTDTAALADELLTLSSTTSLSTDTLQELNYASELLDVSTDTVTGSMTKLLSKINSAADGSESAMEAFTQLGISIYDSSGNLRSTEDIFWEAIDALGEIENQTERDTAAMDLFSKSALELNPLIEAGSETFRELADEAQAVGYVMDGETLDAFGALDDNMQRLTNTAQAVENSFGQVLLPLLTDMSGDAVDLLGSFSGALAGTEGDIDSIGSVIEEFAPQALALVEEYIPQILSIVESTLSALLPAVVSIAPSLISTVSSLLVTLAGSISENSESFISAFSELFEAVATSALEILPILIPIAIGLIETLVSTLLDPANLELLISSALELVMSLTDALTDEGNLMLVINAASTLILSLLGGLTSALPVLIPAALNAILTIVDTLLSSGALGDIMSAAMTLIITLAQSLIDYLPQLIARLPEIIVGIVGFLNGDALPDIINAGQVLLLSLITNLPEIIAGILGALIEIVAQMCDYIVTDGAEDLAANFLAVFGMLSDDAVTWGADIIQGVIDGIASMVSSLTSSVSNVASTISDYLHFSVPEKGPLADFDTSGSDMIDEFIKSMNSEQGALESALTDTAGIISGDLGNFDLATTSNVNQTVDYSGGLSRIEQAIMSAASNSGAGEGGTWVFPIYIAGDHVDTLVVDALDRYNYQTGGH